MKPLFIICLCFAVSLSVMADAEFTRDFSQGEEDYAIKDNSRNVGRLGPLAMGDVNGDGYDDLIMGAPRAETGAGNQAGIVYIRFGLNFGADPGDIDESEYDLTTSSALTIDSTLSSVNFDDGYGRLGGVQINGELEKGLFGSTVAAGDFDGDGIDDIAVSMSNNLEPVGKGRVYVIKGRSDLQGLIDLADERINYRSFYINGREDGDLFGKTLILADLDHDGNDDLIIGTPAGGDGGEVDIFYGRAFSPFFFQGVTSLPDPYATIIRENAEDRLGAALAAGDVTGDGIADLGIGAPGYSQNASNAGKVYFLKGEVRTIESNNPLLFGAVDLETTTDTLMLTGVEASESFGSSIALGDINADGALDIAVGSPYWIRGTILNSGKVSVFLDHGGSFEISGRTLMNSDDADFRFFSSEAEDRLGSRMAFMNLDDNASDDLIITAPFASPDARVSSGEVWIIKGSSNPAAFSDNDYFIRQVWFCADIIGQAQGDFMGSYLAVGDFSGDGPNSDVFFGGNAGVNVYGKSAWGVYGDPIYQRTSADALIWSSYR